MSWNYRVTKEIYNHKYLHEPEPLYCIREVYYDEAGLVSGMSETPDVIGHSLEEVKNTLQYMIESLYKPVINYDTGEETQELN